MVMDGNRMITNWKTERDEKMVEEENTYRNTSPRKKKEKENE